MRNVRFYWEDESKLQRISPASPRDFVYVVNAKGIIINAYYTRAIFKFKG